MSSTSAFYDPHHEVSYVALNKRRRGDYDRDDDEKLVNRIGKPAVKRIYVKRNGDGAHVKPKLFVWRQWQSPKMSQLLDDVGPYVNIDEPKAIYRVDGRQVTHEDDIHELETYYIAGDEPAFAFSDDSSDYNRRRSDTELHRVRTGTASRHYYRDRDWQDDHHRHTSLSAPEYPTHSVRSTYPTNISYPPTPPPRPYDASRYSPDHRAQSSARRKPYSYENFDDYFDEARRNSYSEKKDKRRHRDDYRSHSAGETLVPEMSDFDTVHTIRKDRETLERHKQKHGSHRRRDSAMIFNRRDQTHPDAYIIYVFLNGQGMDCQFMNFQRKQLEKGMNYVLELVARRFNVNPLKLCDMDGRKIGDVTALMSRGAYVLVPVGQSFRDTWYFLPDNAIDTSKNSYLVEERSAQRDRLLQRRKKKEKRTKTSDRSSRSRSEDTRYLRRDSIPPGKPFKNLY